MRQKKIGIIISPAKRLSAQTSRRIEGGTAPLFTTEATVIMKELKKWSLQESLDKLNLRDRYGSMAYERNQNWGEARITEHNSSAILMYNGDVFQGMRNRTLTEDELKMAQKQVKILSALYGLLRPLDLIQPYRLQMSSALSVNGTSNLCDFWKQKVNSAINDWVLKENIHVLINLASEEYFSIIDVSKLAVPVIKPVFRQIHEGVLKSLSVYLKRARGMMVRFILSNKLTDYEFLKAFDMDGYLFDESMSTEHRWVFIREG